jgi:hypothetical protein
MKSAAIFVIMMSAFSALAQSDPCLDKILNTPGKWGKISNTDRAIPAELAIQKKFTNAVNTSLEKNYRPGHLQADRSVWHEPVQTNRPVTAYGVTVYGLQYSCKGEELVLNHETSTTMRVDFNQFTYAELYEASNDEMLTGFYKLDKGMPEEVKPGIWQFPDQRVSLGFGVDGNNKSWLITHDGKLPWSYVTRGEFLAKRKLNLQKQMAAEEPRLKEQLAKWEMTKKYEEQKGDAQKLATFMSSTYNPAVERENASYKRAVEGWQQAIRRVDDQLKAGTAELSKPAIVVNSSSNFRDYDFVDRPGPSSQILVKPNPAYFNRSLGRSVPQFISVEIRVNPKDVVAARFSDDIQSAINFDYLKSFIGKSAPGADPGNPAVLKTSSQATSSASDIPASSAPLQIPASGSPSPKAAEPAVNKNVGTVTTPRKSSGRGAVLSGFLSGPAGASVTLSCNESNDVTVAPAKTGQTIYSRIPVSFTMPVADGTQFKVEVKKAPANMRSVVYNGSGTAPETVDKIRVAVDYAYDLVSRSSDDKVVGTFYETWAPAVGGANGEEGRYVVFISLTKNLDGSDGKYRQVFLRDRNTGVTKMISRAASGEPGNGDSYEPSISADGRTVVFESKASNLVAGDINNVKDIFIWRAPANAIELVSKTSSGGMPDAESFDAMVSGNGQYVVFTSSSTNLVSLPKGRSMSNVFVRDLAGGKTEMISVDPSLKTGGNGFKGSISFDGSRVSFCSASNTLVPNDNNNLWDIFLWQRGKAGLKRISLTHDGKERNAGTESASRQVSSAISGDGRFVAFATTASNMVPEDNNIFQDVFVVNVETGTVSLASFTNDGQSSNGDSPIEQGERVAISYDGTWIAFPTKATNLGAPGSNVILHNTITSQKQAVSNVSGSYVGRPAISSNGGYVVFGKAANLDSRFGAAGIFAHFTGIGPCRNCD